MVAEELNFEEQQQDFDAAEEALSLCDLPLTSNASDWEEYYSSSKEEQSSSFDQDLFEFFSEDFASSTTYNHKDNIIFCGKLIPYREAEVPIEAQDSEICSNRKARKTKRCRLFQWRSFDESRTSSMTTTQEKRDDGIGKTLSIPYRGKRVDAAFPKTKMSVLSSPMKSRWYLFAFGVGRFPTAMELSDIKARQSKKRPTTTGAYHSHNRREMVKSSSSSSDSRVDSRAKWLRMLNVLGCKNQQANAVVKVSFGCIPTV